MASTPPTLSIMPTLTSLNAYSPVVTSIVTVSSVLEFLVYVPTFPVVIFCALIIRHTAMLHRNLKCILLALCLYVFLFALYRVYMLIDDLLAADPYLVPAEIIIALSFTNIIFGSLVGHVLIIERIVATVFVRHYEQYKGWTFTVVWTVLVLLLCFSNGFYQVYMDNSLTKASDLIFYTQLLSMLASLAEIFIISLITYLNVKKFRAEKGQPNVGKLTVRYQLMENIRTGRQLALTFLCHFLSVSLSFLMIAKNRFQLAMPIDVFYLCNCLAFLFHSVNNLTMPVSVVIFHPMLNRNARKLLRYIGRWIAGNGNGANGQVAPSTSVATAGPRSSGADFEDICPLPVDANGRILLGPLLGGNPGTQLNRQNHADTYFQQLHDAWGERRR